MAEETLGAKFSIDITDLKSGISQANRLIKESRSEFKAAAAGMDDWTKSEEGLTKKIKSLTDVQSIQQEKVNALKAEYKRLIDDGLDPTSAEAVKLRTKINEEEAALNKTTKEIDDNKKALADLQSGADKAGDELEDTADSAEKTSHSFEGLKKVASGIAKAMVASFAAVSAAVVKVGKEVWEMANDAAAAGDVIDKQSQKVGMSTDAYQKWDYVLNLAGTSMQDCTVGMKTLTGQIDKAKGGTAGSIEAFNKLGISMSELNSMSREEAFAAAIKGLQGMKDTTERAAIANQLFGKSGQNLTPIFNQTSEETQKLMEQAEKYGMIMSEDAVDASAKFQDSLTTLKGTFSAVKNGIVSNLLPGLSEAMDGFTGLMTGVDGSKEKIINGVKSMVSSLSKVASQLTDVFSTVIGAMGEIAPPLISSLVSGILDNLDPMINAAMSVIESFSSTLLRADNVQKIVSSAVSLAMQLGDALIGALPTVVESVVSVLPTAIPQLIEGAISLIVLLAENLSNIIEPLIAALPTTIDSIVSALTDAQNLRALVNGAIELTLGIVKAADQIINALVPMLPTIIVQVVGALINELPTLIKGVVLIAVELAKTIKDWYENWLLTIPRALLAIVNHFTKWWADFKQSVVENLTELKEKIKAKWDEIKEEMKQKVEDAKEAVKEKFEAMKTAIHDKVDAIKSGIEEKMEAVKKGITEPVEKAKAKVEEIVEKLKKAFDFEWSLPKFKLPHLSVKGGEAPYGIGGKGSLPSFDVQWLKDGGIVRSATAAVVGEDGPEAVIPLKNNTEFLDYIAEKLNEKTTSSVVVNQTNNYSQAHSRYEIYKSKQQTMSAVRLAMQGG